MQVQKIPLVVLWIHEIPPYNHKSFLESFEGNFLFATTFVMLV